MLIKFIPEKEEYKNKINEQKTWYRGTPSTIYIYLSRNSPNAAPENFVIKVSTQLSYFSIYGARKDEAAGEFL